MLPGDVSMCPCAALWAVWAVLWPATGTAAYARCPCSRACLVACLPERGACPMLAYANDYVARAQHCGFRGYCRENRMRSVEHATSLAPTDSVW